MITMAGGALRDYALSREPRDYDLFFDDEHKMHDAIEFACSTEFTSDYGRATHPSGNLTEYRGMCENVIKSVVLGQLNFILTEPFRSPKELIYRFDFTVNAVATILGTNSLYCHPWWYPDVMWGVMHPIHGATEARTRRMSQKGFRLVQ
jgi:hypothetical protein